MQNELTRKKRKLERLENRVAKLEQQLAEAKAAILELTSPDVDNLQAANAQLDDGKRAEEQRRIVPEDALWLARFPDENPNPVARVSDAGIVLYYNQPAAHLPGWTCVLNEPLPIPLRPLVQEALVEGHIVEQEISLGWKIYSVSAVPIPHENYVNLYGQDITEQKKAEEQLKKSERQQREITRLLEVDQARLAAVLQYLPVGVWISDKNGTLINKNKQADQIWSGEAPLSESIQEYSQYVSWHPGDGKPLQPDEYPLAIALRTGKPVEAVELNIQRFDGSVGTVLVSAVPIKDRQGMLTGAVAINVDITERKKVEIALQKRESILTQAGEMAHLGAWDIELGNQDDINANPLAWSDEVFHIFGYEPGEVEPSNELFFERVHPDDRLKIQEGIAKAIATGEPYLVEHRVCRLDGEERIVQEHAEVFFDEVGKPSRIVGAVQDITERKRAEEALAASRQRVNDILASLGDGLMALDKDWTIIYVNQYAAQIAERSAEELVGKNLWELWPGLVGTPLEAIYRQGMESGTPGQSRVQGVQSARWYDVSVYPSGEGITIFYVDKTEQILAEERFSKAFHAGPNALVISNQEDGRIEMVNETFIKLFGYEIEEVLGKTSIELNMFVNPGDRQEAVATLRRDGSVRDFELEVRLKSGEIRNASLSVEMISIGNERTMLTTIQDITARKQAEAALRESEERYRAVVENALDAIIVTDPFANRVLSVNSAACRMFGYSVEEFLQLNREAMLDINDPRFAAFLEEREQQGETTGELLYKRKDGSRFPGEISSVFYQDKDGDPRAVAVIRNVTERKQGESALRQSEEKFSTVFHSNPAGMTITRAADARYTDANESFCHMVGYSREEIIGETAIGLGFFTEAEREELNQQLQQHGKIHNKEFNLVTKSGAVRRVLFSLDPLEVAGEPSFLATMIDITKRKRAEQALRESEERFAKAFRSSPDAIVLSRLSDGMIIDVNEGWMQLFGHSRGEALGRSAIELGVYVNPDDRQTVIKRLQETGAVRDFELNVRRNSGQIRQATLSAELVEIGGTECLLVVFRDVTEQKQAEQALRESERRLRVFFESDMVGMIFWNMDGEITDANDKFLQMIGYSREELLAGELNWSELTPPEYQEADDHAREELERTGLDTPYEKEYIHKDGTRVPIIIGASMLDDKRYEGIAFVLDITERRQAEKAIQSHRQLLETVVNHVPVAVNLMRGSDLRLQLFNPAYQAIAPGKVMAGKTLDELWPETGVQFSALCTQVLETGEPYYADDQMFMIHRQPDTPLEAAYFSWSLHRVQLSEDEGWGILNAAWETTARKHTENALRESEERFRSLADSMPQLVWTALPDGTVDYYNQRYKEYGGIEPAQENHWRWGPVLHSDDLQPTLDAWTRSVETGQVYQVEHRVRMTDGSYRWHLSRGIPIHDENRRVIRWFGTATDIHDVKLAQARSMEYAERLKRSNQELEQFAFMASHDLQEPLRKIEVFGDLLLESSTTLNGRERNYLNRMRDAARRMRDMVDGLLQLSRITTQGKPFMWLELSQLISEVLHDLETQIQREGGRVEAETLPRIEGDATQLHQLMQNLISNALKYHQPDLPPEVKIHATQHLDKVQIYIEDKGIGFDQENAERIFQPFQRLVGRSQYEGSGIGLAICRRIVERHGGEIVARSQPGQGTTFVVTLPIHHSKRAINE